MRKKRLAEHPNHDRWLVSYADFITLLFAFFVVMFASGQTDKSKASQVSQAVRDAIEQGHVSKLVAEILGGTVDDTGKGNSQMRGPGGAQKRAEEPKKDDPNYKMVELVPSLNYLSKELETDITAGKIEVSLEPRGLVVSLKQAAFFPSGTETIDEGTSEVFAKVAVAIKDLPNPVRLEGHTDSVPIHNARFRSNWELSAARAISTLDLFVERYGVRRDRMAIAGYADTAPVSSNETSEGRASNRRVDIVILNKFGLRSEPGAK